MRILFICTGNSFRSIVAEALTKKIYPEIEAESAGVQPASKIASNAKNLLEKDGALEHVKDMPQGVEKDALERADLIVVMESDHSTYLKEKYRVEGNRIENWDIRDPIYPEVEPEDAFQKIKEKVENLDV